MTNFHFPVIDYPRDLVRDVLDTLDAIEPHVEPTDYWVTMPVRVVNTQGAGFCIEIGPYTLDARDIERLRAAIESYDLITKGPAAGGFDPRVLRRV